MFGGTGLPNNRPKPFRALRPRMGWSRMARRPSAPTEGGERVNAVYLFYRTGEPLVALAAGRTLPIEAEQLEGLLSVVGNFVETSVSGSRGYAMTAMRYENLGIVAVRGEFTIAVVVYDGQASEALRANLLRTVQTFEERRWRDLGTLEAATKVAED